MNAQAPGKIIFSGEHAVVHGRPALAMAVDRHISASVEPTDSHLIEVQNFPGQANSDPLPTAALPGLQKRLQENYQRFFAGELDIRHVLGNPCELIQYAVIFLLEETETVLKGGLRIQFKSDLPIGSGMGASAAVIATTLGATAKALELSPTRDDFYRWTLEIEKLQHGHSSGVDPFIIVHGGLVRFQHGEAIALSPPRDTFHLIHTGQPASTTGECVARVATRFPEANPIWPAFQQVTNQMQNAIEGGQRDHLQASIRANHRLLCKIGVVPERVQSFVNQLEAAGGAGKICGAGATQGEAAGILLVLADSHVVEGLCKEYKYERLRVHADTRGLI